MEIAFLMVMMITTMMMMMMIMGVQSPEANLVSLWSLQFGEGGK